MASLIGMEFTPLAKSLRAVRDRRWSRILRDFSYYRWSGTDGYRFGGERICINTQARADTLTEVDANVEALMAQQQKLQRGIDRLIDNFADSLIDKGQFTARMNRTNARIAEINTRIADQKSDEGRHVRLKSVTNRLSEIASQVRNKLSDTDWTAKREIIRVLVQRIEIGPKNVSVVLRLPMDSGARAPGPIMVTLSRA